MARIRVGVRAWEGAGAAETLEEMNGSRNVMWVEIDGQRFDGATLTEVGGKWNGRKGHTTTVRFIGVPEFVFVTKDGTEHGR